MSKNENFGIFKTFWTLPDVQDNIFEIENPQDHWNQSQNSPQVWSKNRSTSFFTSLESQYGKLRWSRKNLFLGQIA